MQSLVGRRHFKNVIITTALAGVIGCGTWLRNPKKPSPTPNAEMSFQMTADISTSSAGEPHFAATTLQLNVSEISLANAAVDEQIGGDFAGTYFADLLAGTITPEPGTVTVTPGNYAALQLTDWNDQCDGEGYVPRRFNALFDACALVQSRADAAIRRSCADG